jgi:hypothetical protein
MEEVSVTREEVKQGAGTSRVDVFVGHKAR